MIELLKRKLSQDSVIRWILVGFRNHPFTFVVSIIRSIWATKTVTGSFFPVRVRISPGQIFKIHKDRSCTADINGIISVNSWGGSSIPSSLVLGDGSNLKISGDFEIGPNVHISISPGAKLNIGGRKNSTGSGITCNSRIMARESISIGVDCIIAWDVFITDSDWHQINGSNIVEPVFIGEKVWISHGVSILKGAVIPSGSIVAAKSLVSTKFEIEKSLIAGIPAKVIKTNMEWNR